MRATAHWSACPELCCWPFPPSNVRRSAAFLVLSRAVTDLLQPATPLRHILRHQAPCPLLALKWRLQSRCLFRFNPSGSFWCGLLFPHPSRGCPSWLTTSGGVGSQSFV